MRHVVKAKTLGSWTGYALGSETGDSIETVDARTTTVVVTTRTSADSGAKPGRVEFNWEANVAVFGPELEGEGQRGHRALQESMDRYHGRG
jgi:hypothetical protein